jgi:hypothetical protein
MIVWLVETLGVDAYVELAGINSAIRLAVYVMILDRDNRHIGDSMDWALDHACASSQNMPALFSAESNRLGNCSRSDLETMYLHLW